MAEACERGERIVVQTTKFAIVLGGACGESLMLTVADGDA